MEQNKIFWERYVEKISNLAPVALFIWSIWILTDGISFMSGTTGEVDGSNFGMLISLVHIGGELLIWFALAGFYIITRLKTAKD